MRKAIYAVLALYILFTVSGCASVKNTDINAVNRDGSPVWTTTEPYSSKVLYGVGKAKLTTDYNSKSAAEAIARASLASKIQSTVKEYVTYYSNDSEGESATAYEQLIMNIVNVAVPNIKTEQYWTAKDGTVWVLVSYPRKDLDEISLDK